MADKANWQPKPEYGERQYRRVDTRLWNDRRFRSFTATGRMVWLFLLTNPRTTSIPGLFPLHEEEAARMCGLSLEGFREGFAQPFREGLVEADWEAGLVWLRNASRYDPPTGPNVVAAWRKVARMSLPECPLLWRALTGIREQLREVMCAPEPFLEAFAKAFPEPLWDGLPEGFAPTDDGRRMTDDGIEKTLSTAVDPGPSEDLPDATADAQPVLFAVADPPTWSPRDLQSAWNATTTAPLPRWQGMSDTRRRQASARLRERPLSEWRKVFERVNASAFCRGDNDRGWRASPDWILQPDSADKVLEGKYDRPTRNSGGPRPENKTGGYTADDVWSAMARGKAS